MSRENFRNVLILIYMVGNALTFNALLKAERLTMSADSSWTLPMLKALALATVWPLYWLAKLMMPN
jgi:hypothetical protein